MMDRIILFANGEYSSPEFYLSKVREEDFIICADGGTNTAFSLGIIPDLVIGDFDSVNTEVLEILSEWKTEFIRYPAEKDESDLELALMKASALQPKEIIIFGALGRRLDHIFANLMLLTVPLEAGVRSVILEEDYEIYLIEEEITLDQKEGSLLSLFPLTDKVVGVSTEGLKYPLDNEDLFLGPSRGLSNEFAAEKAKIRIRDGKLLIIQAKKE